MRLPTVKVAMEAVRLLVDTRVIRLQGNLGVSTDDQLVWIQKCLTTISPGLFGFGGSSRPQQQQPVYAQPPQRKSGMGMGTVALAGELCVLCAD